MSDGGMTVTKTTTGSILLADIQVMVHHQVPTYIPADRALNSADLHRALGSGAIFQMLNTIHNKPAEALDAALADENRLLREALKASAQQNNSLQQSVDGLAEQMKVLAAAVGKIGTGPATVVHVTGSAGLAASLNEAVGGDIPMFLPDTVVPSGADVQLQVQESVAEGDGVSDARSRLRQLRKGQAG